MKWRIHEFKSKTVVAEYGGEESSAFDVCIALWRRSGKRISYYFAPAVDREDVIA